MEVAVGGPIGSELSEPATESSELVGLVAAMIILAFTFGSLVAMGLPIVSAVVGLLVGLSAIGLLGHAVTVPTIAPTLATMIGLGVGIDYALFLVSRHRAQRRDGMAMDESIAAAVATSGTAIVFAGTTVVIALITLVVAGIPLVTSLGYSAAVAVVTAVLASITLLPAVLAVVGTRLESLRLPAFIRPKPKAPERGFWGWWARQVTAHPWLAVAAAAAILVPLIVPFLSLELGQEDIGATPKSTTERQAYDLMAAGFGVGYNGPLLVAAEVGSPGEAEQRVREPEEAGPGPAEAARAGADTGARANSSTDAAGERADPPAGRSSSSSRRRSSSSRGTLERSRRASSSRRRSCRRSNWSSRRRGIGSRSSRRA